MLKSILFKYFKNKYLKKSLEDILVKKLIFFLPKETSIKVLQ